MMGDAAAMTLDEMAAQVVDAALKVHTALGPGLLESAYEQGMRYELTRRQVPFEAQVTFPITYDGTQIDAGFRADLLVGGSLIVELKAVERLLPVHEAQLLTYLRLSRRRLGLLINFNVRLIKDGIKRMAL